MLCLDESTPVILALSLAGAVLLIVGGSLWGTGDASGKYTQMAAGIGLFIASLVLLCLAAVGCWCNKCFCTPERKSRLAERFYGKKTSPPSTAEATAAEIEADLADCGSLGSSFRSFRSFRASRRSLRRDRVQPATDATAASPQAQVNQTELHHPQKSPSAIPEQPEGDAKEQQLSQRRQSTTVQQTSIDDISEVGGDDPVKAAAAATSAGPVVTNNGNNSSTIVSC